MFCALTYAGVGRALAEEFLRLGDSVLITSRSGEDEVMSDECVGFTEPTIVLVATTVRSRLSLELSGRVPLGLDVK